MLPNTKMIVGMQQSTHVIFSLVKKLLVLVKNNPKRLDGRKAYHLKPYLRPFGTYLKPGTNIELKRCVHIPRRSLKCGVQLTFPSMWSKKH